MIKAKDTKKIMIFSVLMVASVILLFVLPLGHDLWYHIYRIGTMAEELRKNPWQLPVRMLSESYNGYGYGAALYYGDLFLYIPVLLVCMGMDEVWAYKIFTVMILWGTYFASYASARLMKKTKDMAMYFAVFYTFSSCSLLNLCIRSAVGESLAFLFLPLVAASFWNIIYSDRAYKNWILLGLSMSAISMSHMLTFLLCTIVLCVWCILEIKKVVIEKKIIEIMKAACLMIGLSASFLFPMFEQMLFQKVQTPGNNDYQQQLFMDYSIEWIDYFLSYDLKNILSSFFPVSWNLDYWHPGTIGLFVFIMIGSAFWLKSNLTKKQLGVVISSVVALVLLGITPVMNLAKEFMAFMQFPWRVLSVITLGLTFGELWILENAKCRDVIKDRVKWMALLGTFFIAGLAIGPRYAYQIYVQRDDYAYIRENRPEYYEKYAVRYDKNAGDALYLPEGVYLYIYLERGECVVANREDIVFDWQRTSEGIEIQIQENPTEEGILELPFFMYKGYRAINDRGEELPVVKSDNGLVSVEIKDSVGKIQVGYEETFVQKVSDIITFLTLLGLVCGYGIVANKSKNRM